MEVYNVLRANGDRARVSPAAAEAVALLADCRAADQERQDAALAQRVNRWVRPQKRRRMDEPDGEEGANSFSGRWLVRGGVEVAWGESGGGGGGGGVDASPPLWYDGRRAGGGAAAPPHLLDGVAEDAGAVRTAEEQAFVDGVLATVEAADTPLGDATALLKCLPPRLSVHIAVALTRVVHGHISAALRTDGVVLCRCVTVLECLLRCSPMVPRLQTVVLVCLYAVLMSPHGESRLAATWEARPLAAKAFLSALTPPRTADEVLKQPPFTLDVVDAAVLRCTAGQDTPPYAPYAMLCLASEWGLPAVQKLLDSGSLVPYVEQLLGDRGANPAGRVYVREAAVGIASLLARHSAGHPAAAALREACRPDDDDDASPDRRRLAPPLLSERVARNAWVPRECAWPQPLPLSVTIVARESVPEEERPVRVWGEPPCQTGVEAQKLVIPDG